MTKCLMDGFRPGPETQVTLANWRTSPFNEWAFHHVREILPTADIPHEPANVGHSCNPAAPRACVSDVSTAKH
jgi:hypothetical protein